MLARAASRGGHMQQLKRRDKLFGEGRCVPLDRNAKARITTFARALMASGTAPVCGP
jgi:hypothetical protein